MDFSKFAQKTKEISQKWIVATKNFGSKTKEFTKNKLENSAYILANLKAIDTCIAASETQTFHDKKTGEDKVFLKYSIIIFCPQENDFQESMILKIPLFAAKTFSQNIKLGLVTKKIRWFSQEKYGIESLPALVLYENMQAKKYILGEENIQKVVNSLKLDIHSTIETLSL